MEKEVMALQLVASPLIIINRRYLLDMLETVARVSRPKMSPWTIRVRHLASTPGALTSLRHPYLPRPYPVLWPETSPRPNKPRLRRHRGSKDSSDSYLRSVPKVSTLPYLPYPTWVARRTIIGTLYKDRNSRMIANRTYHSTPKSPQLLSQAWAPILFRRATQV